MYRVSLARLKRRENKSNFVCQAREAKEERKKGAACAVKKRINECFNL